MISDPNPASLAYSTITQVIEENRGKHKGGSWMDDPQNRHLSKAIRHIETYRMIRDGDIPPDGENHLRNALTRVAMALAQSLFKK